jgi:hypothetical protein
MHDHSKSGPTQAIRIHLLWKPTVKSTATELVLLGVGLMFAWIVVFPLSSFIFMTVLAQQLKLLALLGGGCIAIAASVYIYQALSNKAESRFRNMPRNRLDRLAKISKHSNGRVRLPHRLAECEIRRVRPTKARLKDALARIPPRHVVYLNYPLRPSSQLPTSNDVPFEPIDIAADDEQLKWLVTMNLESGPQLPEFDQPKTIGRWPDRIKALLSVILRHLYILIMFVTILGGGYDLFFGKWSSESFAFLFCAAIFAGGFVFPVFVEKKWFLVPGGVVMRESRLWTRNDQIKVFTTNTHGVLLDAESRTVALLDGTRLYRFQSDEDVTWPTLAAWLSTARTPTDQEIRNFLGLPDPQGPSK